VVVTSVRAAVLPPTDPALCNGSPLMSRSIKVGFGNLTPGEQLASCASYCIGVQDEGLVLTAAAMDRMISSDESVGHFFAFTLAAQLAPSAAERASAAETVAQMVDYLLANGYNLRDWTGYDTTVSAKSINHFFNLAPTFLACHDLIFI
jgi:hypothetical protein